jgi:hypothetical protein
MIPMPDPTPKGERTRFGVRLPVSHDRLYRRQARDAGLDYNTYLALCLARQHGLAWPPPINEDQEELPLSRALA